MDTISISESIVSVTWLKEHLGTKNLIVLDATINKNLDVSNEQIPKGRFFDIKKKVQ
jgi:thiosulfate/3-mercaptopyruvate sulfurtransferase